MSGGRVIYIDAATSEVIVSPTEILNDGADSAAITVRVKDSRGNPVQGLAAAKVVLASTGTGNTVTQPTGVTDSNGEIAGSIVSTGAATKTLSATVCDLAVTDTASLVVGASDAWLANLPSGMSSVADYDFTSPTSITTGSRGSTAGFTDATAPYSPDKVARFVYPAGAADGFGTGQRGVDVPDDTVRVYTSFNIRLSSNYTVHPSNQKIIYLFRTTDQSNGSMVLGIRPGSGETDYTAGTLRWNMQTQTSDATRYSNTGTPSLVRDTWYHVEMLAVMNTIAGTADGVFKVWVDGDLIFDYSNVLFTDTGGVMKWRDAAFDPYYGGNTPGHTIPSECYIYTDNYTVYASTARS
jgi:hypothetical protein